MMVVTCLELGSAHETESAIGECEALRPMVESLPHK